MPNCIHENASELADPCLMHVLAVSQDPEYQSMLIIKEKTQTYVQVCQNYVRSFDR